MNCRCGHGRWQHRRATRLSGWERGRGKTRPRAGAWLPCQATVGIGSRHRPIKCNCRNFKEEQS